MKREEFIEKYRDVKVKFRSYYKYSFSFVGVVETGGSVVVTIGGDSDDIYRLSVAADEEVTVGELWPSCGMALKDGVVVEEFYE